MSPNEQAQDVEYAACMRSHGMPKFPLTPIMTDPPLPSGLDQQAPLFQRATQKPCT